MLLPHFKITKGFMLNAITTNMFLRYSAIMAIPDNSLRMLKLFCFNTKVQ